MPSKPLIKQHNLRTNIILGCDHWDSSPQSIHFKEGGRSSPTLFPISCNWTTTPNHFHSKPGKKKDSRRISPHSARRPHNKRGNWTLKEVRLGMHLLCRNDQSHQLENRQQGKRQSWKPGFLHQAQGRPWQRWQRPLARTIRRGTSSQVQV